MINQCFHTTTYSQVVDERKFDPTARELFEEIPTSWRTLLSLQQAQFPPPDEPPAGRT
jgi:hypothetical protein